MTEQEYIDATNLAKIRTCRTIMRDCLPMREEENFWSIDAMKYLSQWEYYLTAVVQTVPEE